MTDGHDEYDDPTYDSAVLPAQDEADDDYDGYDDYEPGGRRRGKKRRSVPGCIAVLVALAVVVGGFYFLATWGIGVIRDQFESAPDYPGPGHGKVMFEVEQGDTVAEMGRNLKAAGVVESVDAFTNAAIANPDSDQIQFGFYQLKKEMAADDVVSILVDPANLVTNTVTIPEGLTVEQIVDILAKKTKYKASDFENVLDNADQLGLPDYAEGNPEGYLFPATYDFGPNEDPKSMLTDMVDRWKQAAEDADLEARAAELDYTPAELMTIASLIQAEGRGDDMPKISRVIYNRLENPDSGTNGLLQIDAAVNYGLDQKLGVTLTDEQKAVDTPYNVYLHPGLPPTPIEAPGDDAIAAAAHPADGDWFYYVTVNLKTGETKFATTYDEFLQYRQEYEDYCANESAGAC